MLILVNRGHTDFSSEVEDTTLAIRKGRMSILVRLFVHHSLLKFQSRLRFQTVFQEVGYFKSL